ncbi:hypothetical protein GCM10007977_036910 [Dactylosporangium sucinum]|uniref:Uncharacterized protein n=1 Tax=Dactylosporangium sucinum TaxID=1424081 RepID=A0A917TPP1_9ACTN|nr:hypothetical protein GCM10007977_036910 [Dactylosporangium sucinum]
MLPKAFELPAAKKALGGYGRPPSAAGGGLHAARAGLGRAAAECAGGWAARGWLRGPGFVGRSARRVDAQARAAGAGPVRAAIVGRTWAVAAEPSAEHPLLAVAAGCVV